jgi:hypothetical protein
MQQKSKGPQAKSKEQEKIRNPKDNFYFVIALSPLIPTIRSGVSSSPSS